MMRTRTHPEMTALQYRLHYEAQVRLMPAERAALMPPDWDDVPHKQQIYGLADRIWICAACGQTTQLASLMRALARLTADAERRRVALKGRSH